MIVTRRRLFEGAMALTSAGAMASAGPCRALQVRDTDWNWAPRIAHVHNLHTGDSLKAVYFEDGRYVPDAMSELMKVLRDWRSGEEHLMDPRLFDVMHALRGKLDTRQPFQIISGYRSASTNAMMHEHSHQVASNSQHVQGRASDVRLEGVELRRLHAAAVDLRAGGVGYYPVSNFVHVDVGPVRQWMGT